MPSPPSPLPPPRPPSPGEGRHRPVLSTRSSAARSPLSRGGSVGRREGGAGGEGREGEAGARPYLSNRNRCGKISDSRTSSRSPWVLQTRIGRSSANSVGGRRRGRPPPPARARPPAPPPPPRWPRVLQTGIGRSSANAVRVWRQRPQGREGGEVAVTT